MLHRKTRTRILVECVSTRMEQVPRRGTRKMVTTTLTTCMLIQRALKIQDQRRQALNQGLARRLHLSTKRRVVLLVRSKSPGSERPKEIKWTHCPLHRPNHRQS